MRLPLVPPIGSRDGTVEKDCLTKNALVEQDEQGVFATVRPCLVQSKDITGNGNGISNFGESLINIYGTSLYVDTVSVGTVTDTIHEFAQST